MTAETDTAATDLVRETAASLRLARDRLAGASAGALRTSALVRRLDRILSAIERPVRIAVAGEFNTGKSALCNRLVDADTLPTAAIATTAVATRLHHCATLEVVGVTRDGHRVDLVGDRTTTAAPVPLADGFVRLDVGLPAPLLNVCDLIDLPGLADPRFQRRITEMGVGRCDAVLWCTASMQAWKESERSAWMELPARLKSRTILVLTHADLIRLDRDRTKLMDRIRGEYGAMFADIRLVSAKPPSSDAPQVASPHPDLDRTGITGLRTAITSLVSSLDLRRATVASRLARELLREARGI